METFELSHCPGERIVTHRVTSPGIDRALACLRRDPSPLRPRLRVVEGTHGRPRLEVWGSPRLGAYLLRSLGDDALGLLRLRWLGCRGDFELWTPAGRLRSHQVDQTWGYSVLDDAGRPALEIHRPARWRSRFHLTLHRADLDRFSLFAAAVLVEEHASVPATAGCRP